MTGARFGEMGSGSSVHLIVSVEWNDGLVGITFGKHHQIAIRDLATGALIPVTMQEVGVSECLCGVLKALVREARKTYKMDAATVYSRARLPF